MKVIEFPASQPEVEEETTQQAVQKGRPKTGRETKKRINLAVYPSTYDSMQKIAYIDRRSVSDIVSELMERYIEINAYKVSEYDRITKKNAENNKR